MAKQNQGEKSPKEVNSEIPGAKNTRKDGKGKEYQDQENCKTMHKKIIKVNDPNWYAQSPQLLKDSFSLSFAPVLGTKLGWRSHSIAATEIYEANYVAGIMTMHLMPTIGNASKASDAATSAARQIYSYVRHANSGSANYEAADLLMMILAHGSASSFLNALRRLYGTITLFNPKNRLLAEGLVKAQGFDYDSFSTNLNDFRTKINQAALKLNTIKVPKGFPLHERWRWLSLAYFEDDEGDKSQIYIPKFDYYLQFQPDGGSHLVRAYTGEIMTYSQAIGYLEALVETLYSNEDIGIMSGDIMKAFKENVSEEYMITEDFKVYPSREREPLSQVHNAWSSVFFAESANGLAFQYSDIYQNDKGVIKEDITFATSSEDTFKNGAYSCELDNQKAFLDMDHNAPTPEEVAVATRLICGIDTDNRAICGSEIYLGSTIMSSDDLDVKRANTYSNVEGSEFAIYPGLTTAFSHFPTIIPMSYGAGQYRTYPFIGRKGNYTMLSYNTLRNMHNTALLSEFLTDAIIKFTKNTQK